MRLALQNNASDNPEPYEVQFDIDVNESFRSAAAHFLELLESQ